MSTNNSIQSLRQHFPILNTEVHGLPLVYFDNAATTQKPIEVIDAIDKYYKEYNSNVHRGIHYLSQVATEAYEKARSIVASFINAKNNYEVIFTKGTTEAINLVASSFGKEFIRENDIILISAMEHHSNIVPWQLLCEERKAILKIIPINENGELLMDAYRELIKDKRVKLLAITCVSNALGTVNPVKEIIDIAHEHEVPVLLDAAQAIQHFPIDVQELDVDFLAFSGHKLYAPTGIGVLYGKEQWLLKMPPYMGGGDMIKEVRFEKTTYNDLPLKFEAGTPNIEGAIGLGVAIDFVNEIGFPEIMKLEKDLITYALEAISVIEDIRIIGQAEDRASVISFLIGKHHPTDVGDILDQQGIAVRTGHHCTMPLMNIYNIPGTVRASFAFYNTKEEVDRLVAGIRKAVKLLS